MEKVNKFLKNINPREYQKNIYKTCKDKNCLVVLPTGTGKSLIGTMLTIDRMHKFPDSKILILAPTRPLVSQWLSYSQKHLPELFAEMTLFTGKVNAQKRKQLWQRSDIIFSTPQCIANDLKNNLYNLQNISLLVEDECVTRNTEIKLSDGNPINIEKLFENFKEDNKIYVESLGESGNIEPRIILKVHKILNKKQILEIRTKNSKIKTTEDHLLIIKKGEKIEWVKAKNLKYGDKIATDLKETNEKYQNKILVNEKEITEKYGDSIHQVSASIRTIKRLKEKNLLPLDYQNPKLRIIARLIGYILGDGWFTKVNGIAKIAGFSGEIKDLQSIQRDLNILDIKHTKIHSRKTSSLINTVSKNKIIINGTSNAFNVTDSCLIKLLDALESPSGEKTTNPFLLPEWLMNSPRFIKKEFLASLMGCEGDIPKIRKKSRIPYAIRYRFNKLESLKQNALEYAAQIQTLFKEFNIQNTIQIKKGNIRKNNDKTIQIQITFSNSKINFKNFLNNVSYKYNYKKIKEANKILNYINYKERVFEKRELLYGKIKALKSKGFNTHKAIQTIAKQFKIKSSRIWSLGYSKKPGHTSWLVEDYNQWKNKNDINLNVNWEQITSIKKTKNEKYVYDLTVEKNHNYVGNNLIVHNCHRCLKNYAYTYVAKKYQEQAENPKILGLTASPGTNKERIKQIAENLGIETIELRTRESDDVKEYLQELEFNIIKLEFPEEFKKITDIIKKLYQKKVQELKNRKLIFRPANKISLLEVQGRIMKSIISGNKNFNYFAGATACAQAIKLSHLIELLETQTLHTSQNYIKSIFEQSNQNKSKAAKQIAKNPEFNSVHIKINELISKNIEHPKLLELKSLVEDSIKNPKTKIIVFSQYRDTVIKICKTLNQIPNINAKVFVGQAKKTSEKGEISGLNQKEQQEILKEFSEGKINILAATSIGEEGLDIVEVSSVIFYEPIPSAIRKIQRMGRTARLTPGKVIILMTKATLDEIFYYASMAKEKRMYRAIETIQKDLKDGKPFNPKPKQPQKSLFDQ